MRRRERGVLCTASSLVEWIETNEPPFRGGLPAAGRGRPREQASSADELARLCGDVGRALAHPLPPEPRTRVMVVAAPGHCSRQTKTALMEGKTINAVFGTGRFSESLF